MSNSFIMTESIVRPAKMPYGRLKDNGFVGIEGEHAARALVVETKDDLSAFASVNLIIDDLDCGAMTKTTSGNTTTLSMTLTSSMIGRSGRKICQLIMVNSGNTVVQKSSQFEAYVGRANEINRSVDDGVTIIILTEAVTEMAREAAAAAAEEAVADVVEDCQEIANAAAGSARDAAQSAQEAEEAAASITVDATLDPTSTHAIQNKAVASEISSIKADLGALDRDISALAVIETGYSLDVSTVEYVKGYLNSDGTIIATTGTNAQKTTVPIPLEPGDYTIAFSGMNGTTAVTHVRAVAVYNANDVCTNYYQTQGLNSFTVEDTDSYVRFNAQYSSVSEYMLGSDVEETVAIKPNVSIPTDSTLNENKPANAKAVGDAIRGLNIPSLWYMPYRRPLIAFNFDGEYNKNPAFKALFDEHGKKCGFAIPYTNNFPYTSKETYLSWQAEGFEILGHSAVAIGAQSSLTDEEIQQIVQATYSTLVGYGFDIHGFVAYQGNSKQVAINEAQRIFDYAMTMPNHAGDLTGDRAGANIYFAVDQPYNLWRYSMQNSTLQQMKDAVDTCYTTNGLILFYGHANNSALANMTLENIDALLTYIESKGMPIVTPYEAVKDYYTIRPQDFAQT